MAMMRTYAENGLTGMALNYHRYSAHSSSLPSGCSCADLSLDRISSYIGLLFGAAVMAVIGIWA